MVKINYEVRWLQRPRDSSILHLRVVRKGCVFPLLVLHMLEFYRVHTGSYLHSRHAQGGWKAIPAIAVRTTGMQMAVAMLFPAQSRAVLQRRDVAKESGTQITAELGIEPFRDIE